MKGKKKDRDDIDIEVRSASRAGNILVCRIIGDALVDGGFKKVDVINQVGKPIDNASVPSLLDSILENHPDFLLSPVKVQTNPVLDDIVEVLDVEDEDLLDPDEDEAVSVDVEFDGLVPA